MKKILFIAAVVTCFVFSQKAFAQQYGSPLGRYNPNNPLSEYSSPMGSLNPNNPLGEGIHPYYFQK